MSQKLKMVTVLIGLMYDGAWREVGALVEMEAGRADDLAKKSPPLVAFGEHVISVDAGSSGGGVSAVVFDPVDFPGADQLLLFGLKSAAEVKQRIAKMGDEWFAEIPGVGKKIAAQIGAALGPLESETDDAEADEEPEAEADEAEADEADEE